MSIVSLLLRCGFMILLALAANAIASRARTETWIFAGNPPPWKGSDDIVSEDDLTLGLWQRHLFVEVRNSQDLVRQQIAKSQQPLDAEKRKALAEFIVAFLNAYSSDDFELFWSFRVPTDRYTSNESARLKLEAYAENVRRSYKLSDSAFQATDMKSVMATAWRYNVLARGKYVQEGNEAPQQLCTGCISAVAPDTVAIHESKIYGARSHSLMERMKRSPNWGASILPSFLDARPASASVQIQDHVRVEMIIKLTSGKAQPIHIVAGWDVSGHCYIPLYVGMPRSGEDRPILLMQSKFQNSLPHKTHFG